MSFSKEIGHVIKSLRLQQKLSQKELADRIPITQQSLSLYEKGERNIGLDTLGDIINALGASLKVSPRNEISDSTFPKLYYEQYENKVKVVGFSSLAPTKTYYDVIEFDSEEEAYAYYRYIHYVERTVMEYFHGDFTVAFDPTEHKIAIFSTGMADVIRSQLFEAFKLLIEDGFIIEIY